MINLVNYNPHQSKDNEIRVSLLVLNLEWNSYCTFYLKDWFPFLSALTTKTKFHKGSCSRIIIPRVCVVVVCVDGQVLCPGRSSGLCQSVLCPLILWVFVFLRMDVQFQNIWGIGVAVTRVHILKHLWFSVFYWTLQLCREWISHCGLWLAPASLRPSEL